MSSEGNTKKGSTIGNNIYLTLRKNIIDVRLAPGSDISIKELAELLEVSRSPVRDALIRLEKEGLIDTIPQKGTFVSKIDLRRVSEERFFRACLEEKVMGICAVSNYASYLPALEEKIKRQRESLGQKDHHRFLQHDDEFHEIFFLLADKMLCWNMIQNMSGHYRRIRQMVLLDDRIADHNIKEHAAMVQHLKSRETDQLILLTKKHLSKLASETADIVQQFPSYFKDTNEELRTDSDFLKKDYLNLI